MDLTYYPFNTAFFIVLGFFILLFAVLTIWARKKDLIFRKKLLTVLMAITFVGFFVYKYFISIDTEYDQILREVLHSRFLWWDELPLHMCNVNMILIPIGIWSKKRGLLSFSLFTGTIGALMAVLVPVAGFAGSSIFIPRVFGYLFTHWMVCFGSLSLATFGIFRPCWKDIGKTVLTGAVISFVIFLINLLLRFTGLNPYANYFYTMNDSGNAALAIFYKLIPIPYLAVLPAFGILAILMVITISLWNLICKKK